MSRNSRVKVVLNRVNVQEQLLHNKQLLDDVQEQVEGMAEVHPTAASQPSGAKRLSIAEYAPITLLPVFLPIAISVIISAKPNVTAKIR